MPFIVLLYLKLQPMKTFVKNFKKNDQFWFDELEVETAIPDLVKSISKIDELIEKAKTDNRIDVEDLKAERRNAYLTIKKIKRQCQITSSFYITINE